MHSGQGNDVTLIVGTTANSILEGSLTGHVTTIVKVNIIATGTNDRKKIKENRKEKKRKKGPTENRTRDPKIVLT